MPRVDRTPTPASLPEPDPAGTVASSAGPAPAATPTRSTTLPGRMAAAASASGAAAAPTAVAAPALPAWYPSGYDLKAAATRARAVLEAQGEKPETIGPGKASRIVFTDVDLTLMKSSTPTLLKHKTTGEFMKHPETGRLLLLGVGAGREAAKELEELKARYPGAPWGDYAIDYREFGSISEMLRTPAIPGTTAVLRRSDANPKSRDFVITARSDDAVIPGMDEYLARRGVDINGVFAVNNRAQNEQLGLTGLTPPPTSPQKKALAMAALIALYDPQATELRRVKFMDDTDDNLRAAMELLPKLFPAVKFEFTDVVHQPDGGYRHVTVARSGGGQGELRDPKGKSFGPDQIAAYKSADAPFRPDAALAMTAPVTPDQAAVAARAALRDHVEKVLFNPRNPAGREFRSAVLEHRSAADRDAFKRQLLDAAAALAPGQGDWKLETRGGKHIFTGRLEDLYTEVEVDAAGRPGRVYVEVD